MQLCSNLNILCKLLKFTVQIRSDQSLSRVQLFATPWIAARQASLSITNSRSSLRLMCIESVMPSTVQYFLIIFTELCNCHHYLLSEDFHDPQKKVYTSQSSFSPLFGKYYFTFCLYGFAYFRSFIKMESNNMWSSITDFFHLA